MKQSKQGVKQQVAVRAEADRELGAMAERIAEKVADRIVEALGKAFVREQGKEAFSVSMSELFQGK